jgi:hypothetical protein
LKWKVRELCLILPNLRHLPNFKMASFPYKTIKGKLFSFINSFRLSVTCLLYAAVLVVCGTLYQVDHGLYAAQERFFRSWFFFTAGFIPLPGLQTTLVLVIINSLAIVVKRVRLRLENAGLLLMHAGVVFLIAGAGVSSRFINESALMFFKGQTVSESVDFKNWELSVAIKTAHDGTPFFSSAKRSLSSLRHGQRIQFPQNNKALIVQRIYENCQAAGRSYNQIDSLWPISSTSNGNVPGVILSYGQNDRMTDERSGDILVYGGVGDSVSFIRAGDTIVVSFLPRRVMLPIKIGLMNFVLENHPGTSSAKKIESHIHAIGDGINREVVISMNRPFRHGAFTFYQTGFSNDNGQMSSKLTVVENPVRFLPHAASAMIVFGLLFHYIFRLFKAMKADKNA